MGRSTRAEIGCGFVTRLRSWGWCRTVSSTPSSIALSSAYFCFSTRRPTTPLSLWDRSSVTFRLQVGMPTSIPTCEPSGGSQDTARKIRVTSNSSHPQQRFQLCPHFVEHCIRRDCDIATAAFMPVGAFDVVGKYNALHGEIVGKSDFESIALRSTRHRAYQAKPYFEVVGARREHQSGSSSPLFAACLWRERQPDQMSDIGNILGFTMLRARRPVPSPFRHGCSPA